MKLLRSERTSTKVKRNVVGVIMVIIVQSGLKLYDLTVVAAGVEMNKFVIRSHKGVNTCLFDQFEDRLH